VTSPVPTIPTPQDYLDAEEAADKVLDAASSPTKPREFPLFLAEHPAFIAAVDSAFAAGWRARDERRPIAYVVGMDYLHPSDVAVVYPDD
jgi:hypothetical protein